MRKFLMLLSVFAFFATSLAGLAHAETVCDPSSEICATQHIDKENAPDEDTSKEGCDLACSGCHAHCHNHISSTAYSGLSVQFAAKEQRLLGQELIYISDFIYGLKRPPKA
jgi:hypothetical protein